MIDGNRHKKREVEGNLENQPNDTSIFDESQEIQQTNLDIVSAVVLTEDLPKRYKWYQLGPQLAAHGVRANFITIVGLVLAAITAFLIARGYFYVAIVLLTVGGLMDFLDGSVAKASNSTSIRGAFLDSVADRASDALIFAGVAYYFIDTNHPKYALVPLAILAVSQIISYERAKAETLGFDAKGGLMERAERLIFLGMALALHIIFIEMLAVLLLLCLLTAIGRFYKVWMQIPQAGSVTQKPEWKKPKVYSIWRSRRGASDAKGKDWYLNYYKPKRRNPHISQSSKRRILQRHMYSESSFHFNHMATSGLDRKKIKREKHNQK